MRAPLKTDRNYIVVFLLTAITFGIYGIIFTYQLMSDMNVAFDGDGEQPFNFGLFIILTIVTCGIYGIYIMYKMADRTYKNGARYNCSISQTPSSFLLWYLLGACLCGLGPIIAMYKLVNDFNTICMAYNANC